KKALKESILAKVYADQNKTKGIELDDKQIKEKIYQQYVEAFRKGVYNYIKEEIDPATNQLIPRKYFSGGVRSAPEVAVKTGELRAQSPAVQAAATTIESQRAGQADGGNALEVTTEVVEGAQGQGAVVVRTPGPARTRGDDEAMLVSAGDDQGRNDRRELPTFAERYLRDEVSDAALRARLQGLLEIYLSVEAPDREAFNILSTAYYGDPRERSRLNLSAEQSPQVEAMLAYLDTIARRQAVDPEDPWSQRQPDQPEINRVINAFSELLYSFNHRNDPPRVELREPTLSEKQEEFRRAVTPRVTERAMAAFRQRYAQWAQWIQDPNEWMRANSKRGTLDAYTQSNLGEIRTRFERVGQAAEAWMAIVNETRTLGTLSEVQHRRLFVAWDQLRDAQNQFLLIFQDSRAVNPSLRGLMANIDQNYTNHPGTDNLLALLNPMEAPGVIFDLSEHYYSRTRGDDEAMFVDDDGESRIRPATVWAEQLMARFPEDPASLANHLSGVENALLSLSDNLDPQKLPQRGQISIKTPFFGHPLDTAIKKAVGAIKRTYTVTIDETTLREIISALFPEQEGRELLEQLAPQDSLRADPGRIVVQLVDVNVIKAAVPRFLPYVQRAQERVQAARRILSDRGIELNEEEVPEAVARERRLAEGRAQRQQAKTAPKVTFDDVQLSAEDQTLVGLLRQRLPSGAPPYSLEGQYLQDLETILNRMTRRLSGIKKYGWIWKDERDNSQIDNRGMENPISWEFQQIVEDTLGNTATVKKWRSRLLQNSLRAMMHVLVRKESLLFGEVGPTKRDNVEPALDDAGKALHLVRRLLEALKTGPRKASGDAKADGTTPRDDEAMLIDDNGIDPNVQPGYGGIDFNASNLNLQIKRDPDGVPLPVFQQPIKDMKIDGFLPVIIQITPANIPLLLGAVENVNLNNL
ncbi:MAG: hypothetical protein NUV91_01985, partial [Candidatus Omnitrophica bacterium]|nr:hypothetical protein [Candidatus Omnitrophota bacterium]